MNKPHNVSLVILLVCLSAAAEPQPAKKELLPSPVTIKSEAITLPEALAELKKQTGNEVVDLRPRLGQPVPNPPPKFKLNLEKKPFWEALHIIAKQADVNIQANTGEATVGIVKGPTKDVPVSYSGPFRVVLKELTPRSDIEVLEAKLELSWEPRYQPIMLKLTPNSVKGIDAAGKTEGTVREGTGNVRLKGLSTRELTVRLPIPKGGPSALKRLEGELIVLVPPENLAFKFKPTGDSQTQQRVTVKLSPVRVQGDLWYADVELHYPAGTLDLESHEGWAIDNPMTLEKGNAVAKPKDYKMSVVEGGPVRITYAFEPPEKGAKPEDYLLTYQTPAVPVRFPVQFKFENLSLP